MSSSAIKKALHLKLAVLAVFAGIAIVSQPLHAQDESQSAAAPEVDTKTFKLWVNQKFSSCLGVAGAASPTATATVTRNKLNDTLTISGQRIRSRPEQSQPDQYLPPGILVQQPQ